MTALAAVGCATATSQNTDFTEATDAAADQQADAAPPTPDASSDAPQDTRDAAPVRTCLPSLANAGTGDFTVELTLTTRSAARATVAYQRAICNASQLWDIRTNYGGILRAEISDGPNYTVIDSTHAVNDGVPHLVRFRRAAGVLSLSIDGTLASAAAASSSLGDLRPLGTVSGDPCEGVDETVPLVGTVTDVCLTRP